MMAATGCAGVVVGRGCLGRPWLFRDLARVFAGQPIGPEPLLGEVVDVMRRHLDMLIEYKRSELLGVRGFRKHVGWYLTGYPVGAKPRRDIMGVDTVDGIAAILDAFDPGVEIPAAARNLPRGHLHGPRTVELPLGWLDSVADPMPPAGADLVVSGG
jgi:tRNA-dihydrouridine synthase